MTDAEKLTGAQMRALDKLTDVPKTAWDLEELNDVLDALVKKGYAVKSGDRLRPIPVIGRATTYTYQVVKCDKPAPNRIIESLENLVVEIKSKNRDPISFCEKTFGLSAKELLERPLEITFCPIEEQKGGTVCFPEHLDFSRGFSIITTIEAIFRPLGYLQLKATDGSPESNKNMTLFGANDGGQNYWFLKTAMPKVEHEDGTGTDWEHAIVKVNFVWL